MAKHLTQEPGFVTLKISGSVTRKKLPARTAGLLAFLCVDHGKEKVLRILLCDELIKGFIENRRSHKQADAITYHPFPSSKSGTWNQYEDELETRLRLFARVMEKYDPPYECRKGVSEKMDTKCG